MSKPHYLGAENSKARRHFETYAGRMFPDDVHVIAEDCFDRGYRMACLYRHMAEWFSSHDHGTPVPDWCQIGWPIRPDVCEELISAYEKETGLSITDAPAHA